MQYTTDYEISNLRGSSKEYAKETFPALIEGLNKQIDHLSIVEKKEETSVYLRAEDKDYNYFVENKWAHFEIGLYTIRETKKRLQSYIKRLEKIMNYEPKKKESIF